MRNKPPQIKSVISPDNLTGFIYVEAFKESDVKKAIKGIDTLLKGFYEQLQTEPLEQMTQVLSVTKTKEDLTELKPFSWVRLNRKASNFNGDVCQVIFNSVKEKKLLLKLIPRLDHTKPRGTRKSRTVNTATSSKKSKKIQRKKLNVEELMAVGGSIDFGDEKFVKFEQQWYSRTGFLYEPIPMTLSRL